MQGVIFKWKAIKKLKTPWGPFTMGSEMALERGDQSRI